MDRLENMITFVQIVDSGNISTAADRLTVAKSAVSRRLKELETYLGVQLFHRTTRSLNLTASGTAYYQQAVRILDDIVEAENAITQAHVRLQGSIKIAVPYSFGHMHLSPAIHEFLNLHPHIEFDLDFNDRQVDIVQDGFDLAIRIANLEDSSLIARPLASINHVACAAPSYLARYGKPETPKDLAKHRCLAYNLSPDYKSWTFIDRNEKAVKVGINPQFTSNAGESLRDATIAGLGVTYLPTFIVYQQIEQQQLIPILKDYKASPINAYAIYPPTRHLSHRIRTLIDFLQERYSGTPYWDLPLNDS